MGFFEGKKGLAIGAGISAFLIGMISYGAGKSNGRVDNMKMTHAMIKTTEGIASSGICVAHAEDDGSISFSCGQKE